MPIPQISMQDLRERLPQMGNDEIVLDVRGPGEFASGHVPGSRNIPHDQVGSHLEELRRYRRIYIHCRSGKRAHAASETLTRAGLDNLVCIAGSGMDDWLASGFPTERA